MKRIKIFLVLSLCIGLFVGCGEKKNDSIVVDSDTQKTVSENKDIKVSKTMEIEGVGFEEGNYLQDINGKIIAYGLNYKDNSETQFPKQSLYEFKVGRITNEKVDGKNKIEWKDEKIEGTLLTEYMPSFTGVNRILKDGKVYYINEDGELKEITAYKSVVKRLGSEMNRLESYLDGRIDWYYYSNDGKEVGIVDTLENKYYEFNLRNIQEINNKSLKVIGVEEGKVYISASSVEAPYESEIGYIKDNKYYSVISKKDGVNIAVRGDAIYSKGKVLFSGYADGKNGIWKYDVEKKVFSKVLDVAEERFYDFSLNKNRDKIALSSQYYGQGGQYKETLIIGKLSDDFEVTSLQNVISNEDVNNISSFVRWNESKDEFYVAKIGNPLSSATKIFKTYYDVYEVN